MRVGTRLLILKLVLALAVLGGLLLAMHFLLPGLLRRGGPRAPGESYVFAETKAARVTLPCSGAAQPAGQRLAVQLAGQLEAFLSAFCTEVGPALGLKPPDQKAVVNVFSNHAEAEAFAKERGLVQDEAHPSAFYGPASLAVAVTQRPYPHLAGLVLHATAHLLMERAGGAQAQWSTWLAVGMAACAEQGGFEPPARSPGPVTRRDAAVVLALASRSAHVPLHMLVRGDSELFRGPLGALAYRQAGLLVFWLLRGAPPRREAFLRYLQLERLPGPVPPGALEATLGADAAQLENEWLAHLRTIAR